MLSSGSLHVHGPHVFPGDFVMLPQFSLYSFLVFHSWIWILCVYETEVKMWGGVARMIKTERRRFWLLARVWDTDCGGINGYKRLGKSLVVPTKTEHKPFWGSGALLFMMYSIEGGKRHVARCSNTFKLEFPKCPPAIEWINQLWNHKMGYSTAMRVNEPILNYSHQYSVGQRSQIWEIKQCMILGI